MESRTENLLVFSLTLLLFQGLPTLGNHATNKNSKGVALKGYDPVAYFNDGKAVKGKSRFKLERDRVTWLFSSQANRNEFERQPENYLPQYGGYCAYGASQGYLVDIDPKAWKIVEGKLYLNYDRAVQRTWLRNMAGYIAQADGNWPGLSRH